NRTIIKSQLQLEAHLSRMKSSHLFLSDFIDWKSRVIEKQAGLVSDLLSIKKIWIITRGQYMERRSKELIRLHFNSPSTLNKNIRRTSNFDCFFIFLRYNKCWMKV